MALNIEHALQLQYDERGDVLYASIGAPQPALSIEVKPDVLLRYVPPGDEVVGVTMLNFLKHFPLPPQTPLLAHATAVVEQLLQHYPKVPM
jgi:hypothetical protein